MAEMDSRKRRLLSIDTLRSLAPGFAIVTVLSASWVTLVRQTVPELYLDEFFHVPQTQAYCAGKWRHWDPKITTPPGLYLVSWIMMKLGLPCTVDGLRYVNTIAWPVAMLAAISVMQARSYGVGVARQALKLDIHSALNICLFPPIWFFTGLYYTDVLSTLLVLFALSDFYRHKSGPRVFLLGASTLLFRQTNIFWVAIFPAGLSLVSELQSLSHGALFDPLVDEASMIDYFRVVWSLAATACQVVLRILQKPELLLRFTRTLSPFVALLALFTGFVAWNGGVVLGDKSNHVATIHLPQLLYLFAYMAFFSLPLLAPFFIAAVVSSSMQPEILRPFAGRIRLTSPPALLGVTIFTAGFALPAIHYNTIIHPFTLADNRHYVFYVFRILRLYPVLRYAAAPVYAVCAWAVVQALASVPSESSTTAAKARDPKQAGVRVSFVFVWLATSALALVSAPLVEPRYFVLSWIVWRLHVPAMPTTGTGSSLRGWLFGHGDYRLHAETLWFLAVNGVTCYMFLCRGFEWPQQPGQVQRFLW